MLRLIRHGESEANAGGVTSDFGTVALTDLGRLQAEAIAKNCIDVPNAIGVSGYLRAQQTAAPLLARFPNVQAVEVGVHEFTY